MGRRIGRNGRGGGEKADLSPLAGFNCYALLAPPHGSRAAALVFFPSSFSNEKEDPRAGAPPPEATLECENARAPLVRGHYRINLRISSGISAENLIPSPVTGWVSSSSAEWRAGREIKSRSSTP